MGLCIDCVHFVNTLNTPSLGKCRNERYAEINPVDGSVKYMYCENIRLYENTSGNCFKQKPEEAKELGSLGFWAWLGNKFF